MKKCNACEQTKTLEEFVRSKRSKSGYGSKCKPCASQYMREYYAKNPEKALINRSKQVIRDAGRDRFTRHNITIGVYDQMVAKYNGNCWACQQRPATVIDHNHLCCSGQYSCGDCVRGVLCMQCNVAFGLLREDVSYVKGLLTYACQTS